MGGNLKQRAVVGLRALVGAIRRLPRALRGIPRAGRGVPRALSEIPRRWPVGGVRTLFGVSLLFISAGALILSSAFDGAATASVVGGDRPINAGARTRGDISAHNSPTLVRNPTNPTNLAVSNRIDTPFYSCALHVSLNGGATWSQTAIPAPKGEEPKCFGPEVAFGADGTLYFSFVTLAGRGNRPHAVWITTSRNGGRRLSKPRKVLGPLAFQVRLVADPVKPRRLYMIWLQGSDVGLFKFARPGNPIRVMRSDNGGRSWNRPTRVSSPRRGRVVAGSPAVGPKGELYVLHLDLKGDRLDYEAGHRVRGGPPYPGPFALVLARSLDAGATWQESVVDGRLVPISRFLVFLSPFPSVAVDRSGRVYAAFHDARMGDPDVFLWSLAPRASVWEGPKRVNDTPLRDGTWQYLPKVTVSPGGRLDITYYDRRRDPKNVMSGVSLQSSFDGGRTFTPALSLASRPFDSTIGFGRKEGLPDLGSRLGLLSEDQGALAVWSDTRAGSPATQKQDLAAAVVAFGEGARISEPAQYALRYGGLAVGILGLAVLATGVLRLRLRDRLTIPGVRSR